MAVVLEQTTKTVERGTRCCGIFIHAPAPTYLDGVKQRQPQYILHKYEKYEDDGEKFVTESDTTYRYMVADLAGIAFPNGITGAQIMEALLWMNDNRISALSQVMTAEQIDATDIERK